MRKELAGLDSGGSPDAPEDTNFSEDDERALERAIAERMKGTGQNSGWKKI